MNSIRLSAISTFTVYVFEGVTALSNKVSEERDGGKSFAAPYRYCVSLKNDGRVNITREMNIYDIIFSRPTHEGGFYECNMSMDLDLGRRRKMGRKRTHMLRVNIQKNLSAQNALVTASKVYACFTAAPYNWLTINVPWSYNFSPAPSGYLINRCSMDPRLRCNFLGQATTSTTLKL